MYQLTYSQLSDMGFESPDKVAVFGFGGLNCDEDNVSSIMAKGLPRQTSMQYGDKLIFYGEGAVSVELPDNYGEIVKINSNPYSLYGYYFLTEADHEPDVPVRFVSDSLGNAILSHRHVEVIDCKQRCYENMGTRWFDIPFQNAITATYGFNSVCSSSDISAGITVSWLTDTPGSILAELSGGTILDAEGLSVASVKKPSLKSGRIESVLSCGEYPELNLSFSNTDNKGFTAIDYLAIDYEADNVLSDRPQTDMYIAGINPGDYIEMNDAVEIWDITSVTEVKRLELADGKVMPDASCRKLVAFDPSRELLTPETVGVVGPQNLPAEVEDWDMLIISQTAFLESAEELADIHRNTQNLNVRVVTDEQIYNEVSSGQPSGLAIRAYVKWLYEETGRKLKYMLLYGDGSYDNRGILEKGPYLPTYQCPIERYMYDSEKSYCSDAYFGMTDDQINADRMPFGDVSVSIGRLPVRSVDEAYTINEKIKKHIEGRMDAFSGINMGVFISDSGDSGIHLKNADALASAFSGRDGFVAHKVYSDLSKWVGGKGIESKKEYAAYLRDGCEYVHYVGHGTEYNIAGQDLWSVSDVSINKYTVRPIVFHSSCLNGRFDGTRRSLAEEMLVSRIGGAVGCIMAARNTDATYNQRLHKEFIGQIENAAPGTTFGDVWMTAQNICLSAARSVNNSAFAINVRHFNLIGDPALPLHIPEYAVVANSVNNLADGCGITINGEIRNTSSDKLTGFNGNIEARAYRTDISRMTLGQDGTDSRTEVAFEDILIGCATAKVFDGEFNVAVRLPATAEGSSYRIICFATDGESLALGSIDGLSLSADSEWVADVTPPEITALAVSGIKMSGMTVSPESFCAEIVDSESGICYGKYIPENAIRLTLDGIGMNVADIIVDEIAESDIIRISYPLPEMSDGNHELVLSVSDNAGNRTAKSLTFSVLNRLAEASLNAEFRSVRDEALFSWQHDLGQEADVRLLIRNMSGQTVYFKEFDGSENFFEWNLRGLDGSFVADGPYKCFLLATDGRRYTSSEATGIVVLK